MAWTWDASLYAGSAEHYARGRMPYPDELGTAIRAELGLDGTGRLLDVGCGPGSLTLLLAPYVAAAVGVDADPDMVAEAAGRAPGIEWRHLRAEELPAGLGTFRVVTFAQSFHWMDQPVVAGRVRGMLEPGGAWVHVGATTHRGVQDEPWRSIDALVARYLGPVRRAGQGTLPNGGRSGEDEVLRRAGFRGPVRLEIAPGEPVERGLDEIVSAVFSLSSSAPHLFADRLAAFESDLRRLLQSLSPSGRCTERRREITVTIWRP